MGLLSSSYSLAEDIPHIESIGIRSHLTGDWDGLRSTLADRGGTLDVEYTSTYQGIESGTGTKGYEYGGKFDGFLNLDSDKLGLWQGGGLRTHFEYRHGKANAFRGGALWPVNSTQALPLGSPEKIVLSSLYLTQKTGDHSSILLGKINVLDLLASDTFFGGWGNRRFMNIAFVAPPSGVLPPVIFGAIASIQTEAITWTAMVFDPNDRTTDYIPGDLFSAGVNASLSGTYTGTLAGRKTSYTFGAIYSTKAGKNLSEVLLPPELKTGNKNGSYNVSFQFSHELQERGSRPGDGWGVFLKTGIADGNPNPIRGFVIGGLGGKGLFPGRSQDSFGLGYFYYAFSNNLQSALSSIIHFDDEQGLEIFYSYAMTPWFHLTGDLQYINPASGNNGNGLVLGLRSNIRF